MIFVTTGTQEPFDRLIQAIDEIAHQLPGVTFNVQAFLHSYQPKYIEVASFISPSDFEYNINNCELIIAHAGMGTIISALVNSKPIVVMPRLLKYQEHRNEHQLATAKKMDMLGYVHVAYNEQELIDKVLNIWPNNLKCLHNVGRIASQGLMNSIDSFIRQ